MEVSILRLVKLYIILLLQKLILGYPKVKVL